MHRFVLGDEDGVIIFRQNAPEEFYVPEGEGPESLRIRSTIAFFVYATQREDWVNEFEDFIEDLQKEEKKGDDQKTKFKHLKLIK